MTPQQIQKVLVTFRRFLSKSGKHENTVRSYAHDVAIFLNWMRDTVGEGYQLTEISKSEVMEFRGFLMTRQASPTSVNRRITALRQFFDFCMSADSVSTNPAALITGVPAQPAAPVILTRKDALLLIRTAERKRYPVDGCVILLLLHCGLRSQEITGLTIGDLYLTPRDGRLFIKGQRGKTMRFVPLSTRTQAALKLYCKRRGITMLARRHREDPLLTLMNGNPLNQQNVDAITKRNGKEAGIQNVTPTMLRNTYAIHSLLQGDSPEAVARMLGVASVRNIQKIVDRFREQGTLL